MIEEKIGEAIGLEKAAQKAVEILDSRGLLKPEQMKKLSKMKKEAGEQEQQMEDLVGKLTDSDGLNSEKSKAPQRKHPKNVQKLWRRILVRTLTHKRHWSFCV